MIPSTNHKFRKWFSVAATFLVLLAQSWPVAAQYTHTPSSPDSLYRCSPADIPSDVLRVVVSPFRWNRSSWLTAAGWLGATALALPADRPVNDFFQTHSTPVTREVSRLVFEPLGSGLLMAPFVGGAWLVGRVTRNSRLSFAAYRSAEAWLFAAGAAQVAKFVFHRHRPWQSPGDAMVFGGPGFSSDYVSFPSGHTTSAFAVAAVWARVYSNKPWVGMAAFSLASLVGVSRMHDQEHWLSDVVAGAAVGYWIGTTLAPRGSATGRAWTVVPMVGSQSLGVMVHWSPFQPGGKDRLAALHHEIY